MKRKINITTGTYWPIYRPVRSFAVTLPVHSNNFKIQNPPVVGWRLRVMNSNSNSNGPEILICSCVTCRKILDLKK